MKKLLVSALAIFLAFSVSPAVAEDFEASADFGVGYRVDEIGWNAAVEVAPGTVIDPFTEDSWKNMDIVYAKSSVRMSYKKIHGKADIGYGRVVNGEFEDTYYGATGRTSEIFRQKANTNGWVFDLSAGVGYEISLGNVTVIPLVGYSWHVQQLEASNATQLNCNLVVFGGSCPPGSLSYEPRWQGPWLGVDVDVQPSEKLRLYAGAEYHFGELKADSVGPTLSGLDFGFEHVADAEGVVLSGGIMYSVAEKWDVGFETKYTHWESDPGRINSAGANGRLNEIEWESYELMFNATYRFYQVNNNKMLTKM